MANLQPEGLKQGPLNSLTNGSVSALQAVSIRTVISWDYVPNFAG